MTTRQANWLDTPQGFKAEVDRLIIHRLDEILKAAEQELQAIQSIYGRKRKA